MVRSASDPIKYGPTMADRKDEDQVRAEFLEHMGDQLGQLHFDLRREIIMLHAKWHEFTQLYAHSEERVKILNRVAPWFFFLLQRTLLNDVLLHLCRLTDAPEQLEHENLTLRRIPEELPPGELRESVEQRLANLLDAVKFARQHRNKKLAHLDLPTYRDEHPEPLQPATKQAVESALSITRSLMHEVQYHYVGSKEAYEQVFAAGDTQSLLGWLKKGIHAEDDKRKRLVD